MPTPQERLAAAQASWNAGDLDGYLELYDDAIRLHGYSPEPMGKSEVRAFYQAIFAAFDSPQLEFHEVLWDGDACTIRFTMSGRHAGEFSTVERFSQADMLGLMVQMGAIPAPA
jgi:ketosteroid isomerase-like protein